MEKLTFNCSRPLDQLLFSFLFLFFSHQIWYPNIALLPYCLFWMNGIEIKGFEVELYKIAGSITVEGTLIILN